MNTPGTERTVRLVLIKIYGDPSIALYVSVSQFPDDTVTRPQQQSLNRKIKTTKKKGHL